MLEEDGFRHSELGCCVRIVVRLAWVVIDDLGIMDRLIVALYQRKENKHK